MTRVIVKLSASEWAALLALSQKELRDVREQARYLIIRALAAETVQNIPMPQATPQAETALAESAL